MTRTVKEWAGSSDDARVPPRVRLRIFERHGGVCHLSGVKIVPGMAWDLDHIVALVNGGKHCESNLAPALKAPHRVKTAKDVAEKSAVARKRKKALGIKAVKPEIKSAGFPPAGKQNRAATPSKLAALPRPSLYGPAE
jgi:5-methylcytosine-specific restriction enzyme A